MRPYLKTIVAVIGLAIAILGLMTAWVQFAKELAAPKTVYIVVTPTDSQIAAQAESNSSSSTYKFTVKANQLWQDTKIKINAGDHVTIHYLSGKWGADSQDASGNAGYICAEQLPESQCTELVPDAVQGSLVGRIGTQILKIGYNIDFIASKSGTLQLSRNHDVVGFQNYGDVGEVVVEITVTR